MFNCERAKHNSNCDCYKSCTALCEKGSERCWPADISGSDDDAPVGSGQRVVLHFVPHVVDVQPVCSEQLSVSFSD